MDSSMGPVVPPAVRVRAIVAGGSAHVATPPWVKVNFTGTTPRLTLKTLVLSALMGCCTCEAYAPGLHTPALPALKRAWISDSESGRLKIWTSSTDPTNWSPENCTSFPMFRWPDERMLIDGRGCG